MQSRNNKSCLAVFALCSLKISLRAKVLCMHNARDTPLQPPPGQLPPCFSPHTFDTHTELSKQLLLSPLLFLLFHSRAKVKCVIYKSVWGAKGEGVACRTTSANSRAYCRRHIFRLSRQQQQQLQWGNKRNPRRKNARTLPPMRNWHNELSLAWRL